MSIAHSPTEKFESIFSEAAWLKFITKVEDNFVLKTYPQFDPYFNFPKDKRRLKKLLSDPKGESISRHSFLPFVKIVVKTPRYKYQDHPERDKMKLSAKERDEFYDFEVKPRPIAFASHFDTYIYGFYSFVLNEQYQRTIREKGFSDCVLAYRTDLDGQSNIQFAKEAFDQVKRLSEAGPCTAFAFDIKGYFDTIRHNKLKEIWAKFLGVTHLPKDQYKIFRSLTAYSYVSKNQILKHFGIDLKKKKKKGEEWTTLLDLIPDDIAGKSFIEKFNLLRSKDLIVLNKPKKNEDGSITHQGIPQGSSISAFLSNLYLMEFDAEIFKISRDLGFEYRRYCDDLLIICPSEIAQTVNSLILEKITACGLVIQDAKTEEIEFTKNSKGKLRAFNKKKLRASKVKPHEADQRFYKNLQYLGFEFNGQNIYIRPGSLSRYFRKMKGRITKTIMMARGKKSKSDKVFKAQLYHRYTHLGKKNFLNYAYKASKKYFKNSEGKLKTGMNSPSIRKQLKAHFNILRRELRLTDLQIGGIRK